MGIAYVSVLHVTSLHDSPDEIHELRKREKEQGHEPDWEMEYFMKASAARGKRHSIMTDYVMRMLGLEVRGTLQRQGTPRQWWFEHNELSFGL